MNGFIMSSNQCSFHPRKFFSVAWGRFSIRRGHLRATLGQNMKPVYGAKFLTSMIVLSTYKYFPKYIHGAKMFSNQCSFQPRKNFFRGIVQFFGENGAVKGNFKPKYVASLWRKVPHFHDCFVNI